MFKNNRNLRRNNYDELASKFISILIIFFQVEFQTLDKSYTSFFFTISFFLIFLARRNFGSSIDHVDRRFKLSLSSFNVWFSFILTIQIACKNIYKADSTIFLIGFISLIFTIFSKKEDPDFEIVKKKFDEIETPSEIQVYLEKICLMYRKAQGGSKSDKILIGGYIESIQFSSESDADCPLILDMGSDKDSETQGREKKAFIEYVGSLYLKSIAR